MIYDSVPFDVSPTQKNPTGEKHTQKRLKESKKEEEDQDQRRADGPIGIGPERRFSLWCCLLLAECGTGFRSRKQGPLLMEAKAS